MQGSATRGLARWLLAGVAAISPFAHALAQDTENTTMLDTIVIESESDDILVQDGYVAKQDRIGTKVDTPLVKIPQAISVVTQDQIEDQKSRSLNEALSYTASANPNTFGFDSRYDAFFLRGFPAYYNGMFRDGLRQYNGPSAFFKTEPYGIEGVTILKGPASSLYGISGPGGIVNVVTKRPKEEKFNEVEALIGTDNRYQAALDSSGPINDEETLFYRFTTLGRKADTELPGYSDDKFYIAPALTWKPDEDTKVTILGEYSDMLTGGTAAFYNPAYGKISNLYEGDKKWNRFDQEQSRIGYEVEHRISDVVTLRQNLRYNQVDANLQYSGHYATGVGTDLARYWGHYKENMENFVVDNMAQFEFDTGPVEHVAVAGVDYAWSKYEAYSGLNYVSVPEIRGMKVPFSGSQEMDQLGVYLHDQMKIENFTVFASGRHDWVSTDSTDATFADSNQKDNAFSYRLGASYKTDWGTTPYANYSTSFSPNIGFVYDDVTSDKSRVANPTIAKQTEVGIKQELTDLNATVTASVFNIDQNDGVVFDASTGINKQRQLDLNSRGFELEANGSLDNGWGWIASYTYMRMKIVDGAEGTDGKELSATPNHTVSLWGHYKVEDGAMAGWGIGSGVRYLSSSYGDDQNTFKNKARAFVDGAVSYDFSALDKDMEGLTLQINAKNLFNTREKICSAGYCYKDEGRTVMGSLRYR
ncbi:TonB-dependent siderophore receptor, partial [bacterium]